MTEERTYWQCWINCPICNARVFDEPGPVRYSTPADAERCKGGCLKAKEDSKP